MWLLFRRIKHIKIGANKMALDFPNSPTPEAGDIYTGANGVVYTYDGVKWVGQSIVQFGAIPSTDRLVSGAHAVVLDTDGKLQLTSNGTITSPDLLNLETPGGVWQFGTDGALTFPDSSIITHVVSPIETIVADVTISAVLDYSTGTALPPDSYGNSEAVAAPWTVYQLTATPDPVLELEDVVGGASIPELSNIVFVGTSAFSDIIITDKTFTTSAPPASGSIMSVVRPVVNAGLQLNTIVNTDIVLQPGTNGHIITHSDILPFANDAYRLGSPAKRFKELWLGAGTLFVLDETLNIDLALGARDGSFYIAGAAGLDVGEFQFLDNTLLLKELNRDLIIGQQSATGYVQLNRPLRVTSGITGKDTFTVQRSGLVTIRTPSEILTTQSAVEIIGTSSGNTQPRTFSGTLLQLTAQDGQPARVSIDAFGTDAYPIITGRQARGTVNAPSATQNNDILLRVSTQGFGDTGFISSIGRIDIEATQNFTDAHAGTRIRFQTTPTNSITIQTSTADIDANGLSFSENITGGISYYDERGKLRRILLVKSLHIIQYCRAQLVLAMLQPHQHSAV